MLSAPNVTLEPRNVTLSERTLSPWRRVAPEGAETQDVLRPLSLAALAPG